MAPQVFPEVEPRLERFLEPFVSSLVRREQVAHARTFVSGLLSDLDHRNVESIAYHFGQSNDQVDFPFDGRTLRADATFVDSREILIETHLLRRHRLTIDFVAETVKVVRV